MAKSAIRKLKMDRFWRWLYCDVYGKPVPKNAIKLDRRVPRLNRRKLDRAVTKIMKAVERHRAENS